MSDINQTQPILGAPPTGRHDKDRERGKREEHPGDATSDGEAGSDFPRDIDVVISLMGLPAGETPEAVRQGLGKVMAEFDRQRAELERVQLRAAYLEEQQDRDPVLPVAGRLALLRRLSRALHRSEQSSMTNALVAFHVEGVEVVRLTYGRPVAELFMAEVATHIQETLRQTDFLASLGGYDFGLLLPLAGAADAEQKARTIADAIDRHSFQVDGDAVHLTVRWGLAVFEAEGDPDAILRAADADLMNRSTPAG